MPRLVLAFGCMMLMVGCASSEGEECVAIPSACAPLYEPTFENIYSQTFASKCSVGNTACHSTSAAKGDLVLEGMDAAYESLMAAGYERVNVDEPGCGVLAQRIESDDSGYVMPLGAKLSDAERCSIHLWVRDGAKR
jgi:hypothetical protein